MKREKDRLSCNTISIPSLATSFFNLISPALLCAWLRNNACCVSCGKSRIQNVYIMELTYQHLRVDEGRGHDQLPVLLCLIYDSHIQDTTIAVNKGTITYHLKSMVWRARSQYLDASLLACGWCDPKQIGHAPNSAYTGHQPGVWVQLPQRISYPLD